MLQCQWFDECHSAVSSMQLGLRQRTRTHPVSSESQERRSANWRWCMSADPRVISHWRKAGQTGLNTSGIVERVLHASLSSVCTGYGSGLVTSEAGTSPVWCGRVPWGWVPVLRRHSEHRLYIPWSHVTPKTDATVPISKACTAAQMGYLVHLYLT